MTKPIPDKAEVALEYADKLYIGTFAQTARFDAHFDKAGISLSLYREGGSDTRKICPHALSLRAVCRNCAIWRARQHPFLWTTSCIARRWRTAPRLFLVRSRARPEWAKTRTTSPN